MKVSLAVAGVALVAATLAGCGGGSEYCTDLKAAQETFENLDSGDVGTLQETLDTFHELAAEAPDEIKDDWKVFDDRLTGTEEALESAGLTFEDLAGIQSGQVPEDVDRDALQEVVAAITELGAADTADASEAIEEHASEVCDVELPS